MTAIDTTGAAVRDRTLTPQAPPFDPDVSRRTRPLSDLALSGPKPKDPRYLALRNFAASITVFNIFGYWLLGFEQPYLWPVIAVLVAYATDLAFETLAARLGGFRPRFATKGARGLYEFLLPSHITALAVNMLLYANNQIWPVVFGVIAGVSAKYVLQAPIGGRMRHFMNPSNFGITMALLFFGSWVSVAPPYQFAENVNSFFRIAIAVLIVTAGTILNAGLTKKIPLIVGWLGGFVIQAVVRGIFFDISIMAALSVMTGIAFVLFTNYMISDPGTTPFKPRWQFLFGSSVAVVYGVLVAFNVVYTLFFAVTIVCAARGIGWWLIEAQRRRHPENIAEEGVR